MTEAPLRWWESIDDVCDTSVRVWYHAVCCYPCVYGAALHRSAYSTRFHVPLCVCSRWWAVGTIPCVGACCLRSTLDKECLAAAYAKDTVCCCCYGAPCMADDYRTHDVELHNLLVSYQSHMLPIDTGVLAHSAESEDEL